MSLSTNKKYIFLYCAISLLFLTNFQVCVPKFSPLSPSSFSYSILPGSKISIIGTTNVSEFTCFSNETSAMNAGDFHFNDIRSTITFKDAVINLSTQSLECGNEAMNHNLYKTLHSEEFPFIVIDLQQVKSKNGSALSLTSWTPMTADVYIGLAGVRRFNQIDFTGKQTGSGIYHFTGSHDLSFSDYNINPPSALFGLIKVMGIITVKFDLQVSTTSPVLQ